MGTQGVVSVVHQGDVIVKAICGCNGSAAELLARRLLERKLGQPNEVYDLALSLGFGCRDCLVIMDRDSLFSKTSFSKEMSDFYREHFPDPQFNPRWASGAVGELFIVPA